MKELNLEQEAKDYAEIQRRIYPQTLRSRIQRAKDSNMHPRYIEKLEKKLEKALAALKK